MALNIGELVGFIRADDSGFRRGLDAAQVRMVTLRQNMNNSLRDISNRFRRAGSDAGRGLVDGIRTHAATIGKVLKGVGAAVASIGIGLPALAAVTAGLLGLASGAAAAGIAVKAFTLAAGKQWQSVQDVAKLADDAQKAAASGAKDAADKQKAYLAALAQLPPATQQTAKAFIGLKGDFSKWSDSLSGTTMPVFTKGIQILRDLLPTLTPFVKSAASALSGFLDDVGRGVKSAGFKEWAADMAKASGPALSNFLKTVKNLAVGFGGLLSAFLPASDKMTGGLADLSKSFADWATSLKGSDGFAKFMDLAKQGGQTLGLLATAAFQVLSALSPLIGVTSQIATWIAQLINVMPPGVLTAIGTAWAAIALGIKAYGLYQTIASAATRAWAIAQGIFNAVMAANPIVLVIAVLVALAAALYVAYKKSETFREIVQGVWAAVKSAISTAVDGIMSAVGWFAKLPGKIAGWFGAAKDWAIRKFKEMVAWVAGIPARASSALSGLKGALQRRAAEAGVQLVSAIKSKLSDAISWVKGLPGRAKSALGGLGRVLFNAGASLIRGFINGLKSMFGSVKGTLGSLTSKLSSWKGPETLDKKILRPNGRMVLGGFMRGIADQTPALRAQLAGVTGDLPGMAMGGASAASGGAGRTVTTRVVLDGEMGRAISAVLRARVQADSGGNVQLHLGSGRG